MIDSSVRITARRLTFGASDYRAIVLAADVQRAQDMVSYYRHLANQCTSLRYLDICAAAYWASIADAITARRR